ncbi:MAG: LysR family transcriptional regulator [Peptococcaceae bacterium]|nr:LysR family transcriptional regulator [Peptococcaceae bacterium]
MHVNQLIYFSKVVETGAIRVAAQKLHISQPALSKSIKELETELGQVLISRTNRGIQPTAIGWKIYKEFQGMKPIIEGWYATEEQEMAPIHISCIHSATSMFLNQIVIPFKKTHPSYEIVMQNQYVTEVFDTLKNSPVNIAVTSLPQLEEKRFLEEADKKNLNVHLLFEGTRCLLVGATHPIAQRESLTQEDLKDLSMVTYSTSRDRPAIIYAPYFRDTYKLANKESIMELVIENEAVWLPIEELVANDFYVKNHLVKMYPIPISEFAHKISVVAITTAALSEHEEQFVCYLLDHFSAK